MLMYFRSVHPWGASNCMLKYIAILLRNYRPIWPHHLININVMVITAVNRLNWSRCLWVKNKSFTLYNVHHCQFVVALITSMQGSEVCKHFKAIKKHTHTHTHTHARMHAHMHTCMHTHPHTHRMYSQYCMPWYATYGDWLLPWDTLCLHSLNPYLW